MVERIGCWKYAPLYTTLMQTASDVSSNQAAG
jgi:hypothetical protein